MAGHEIGQPARLVDVHSRDIGLFGQRLARLDGLLKQRQHGAHQRLDGDGLLVLVVDGLDTRYQVRFLLYELQDAHAPQALDENGGVAIGHLEHAPHIGLDADLVQVLGADGLLLAVALGDDEQIAVMRRGSLDGAQRLLATDVQWDDGTRKDHRIDQREHGEICVGRDGRGVSRSSWQEILL